MESSGLDLPDDEFDYEKYVDEEFGERRIPRKSPMQWVWWTVALGLLILMLLSLF